MFFAPVEYYPAVSEKTSLPNEIRQQIINTYIRFVMLLTFMTLIFLGCLIPMAVKVQQINKIRSAINRNYTQEIEDKTQIKKKFKEIVWLFLTMIILTILANLIHYLTRSAK